MSNNAMTQPQMQQAMQGQSGGPTAGAPNAFPQAYGTYPGMNPGNAPAGYYATGTGSTSQPQSGQQNPAFAAGYQNYSYSQPSSEN